MTQSVLLPLYKIEVSYVVRHGRRWSALEHLVLWACKEPVSPTDLATQTNMPLRLIAECLVNLLRASWVELRVSAAGTLFATTRSGAVVAEKVMPDRFSESQSRTAYLFLERLTGEVFSQEELAVVYRHQTGFTALEALGPEIYNPNVVGPELISRLPLGRDDSYERLRDYPRILPGEAFAVLQFEGGSVFSGLPDRTPTSLLLAIRHAIEQHANDRGSAGTVEVPSLTTGLGLPLVKRGHLHPVVFSPDCLVVGGKQHLQRACSIIEDAERIVVVHSTFVGRNIGNLLPTLAAAAEKGVNVYLHWGKKDDPEGIVSNPSEMAARLAVSGLSKEAQKNIHLGTSTTGSHAKVLLADSKNECGYVAMLGSCNWLDSPFESLEASIQISEPAIIGQIATILAYLVAPTTGSDPVVGRLIDVYTHCSEQPGRGRGPHTAMLVVDEDHLTALRDAMNKAKSGSSVLVGSHKLGHAAETTVFDPMREAARQGARVELVYTRILPNLGLDAAAASSAELMAGGINLRRSDWEMHAKFLACNGDTLLVTSFNFMATTLGSRLPKRSEVGVLLVGPEVVEEFKSKLAAEGAQLPPARVQVARGKRRRRRNRPVGHLIG